jgi:hypothetical protein
LHRLAWDKSARFKFTQRLRIRACALDKERDWRPIILRIGSINYLFDTIGPGLFRLAVDYERLCHFGKIAKEKNLIGARSADYSHKIEIGCEERIEEARVGRYRHDWHFHVRFAAYGNPLNTGKKEYAAA